MGALAVSAMLAIGIVSVGQAAVTESQAQAGADAAALAGAADGIGAATEAAERNGGVLVSLSASGNVFTATVRIGESTAIAHAERQTLRVPTR